MGWDGIWFWEKTEKSLLCWLDMIWNKTGIWKLYWIWDRLLVGILSVNGMWENMGWISNEFGIERIQLKRSGIKVRWILLLSFSTNFFNLLLKVLKKNLPKIASSKEETKKLTSPLFLSAYAVLKFIHYFSITIA